MACLGLLAILSVLKNALAMRYDAFVDAILGWGSKERALAGRVIIEVLTTGGLEARAHLTLTAVYTWTECEPSAANVIPDMPSSLLCRFLRYHNERGRQTCRVARGSVGDRLVADVGLTGLSHIDFAPVLIQVLETLAHVGPVITHRIGACTLNVLNASHPMLTVRPQHRYGSCEAVVVQKDPAQVRTPQIVRNFATQKVSRQV